MTRRVHGLSPMLFVAQVICLLVGTHAAAVFEAYRLVQYDHQGVPAGSRSVRLAQVLRYREMCA